MSGARRASTCAGSIARAAGSALHGARACYHRAMSVVIDAAWARAFAEAWCDAWNAHDLPRILEHYTDDFEMASPFIVERGLDPSGVLRGKSAVADYWRRGLEAAQPPLRFELINVYVGVDSVVLHYRSVGRRLVVEVLTFDARRRVIRGSACWGPAV